jgi:hypothetical protein
MEVVEVVSRIEARNVRVLWSGVAESVDGGISRGAVRLTAPFLKPLRSGGGHAASQAKPSSLMDIRSRYEVATDYH